MNSGKIDDPVDASSESWPDEPSGFGKKLGDLALSFAGLVFPPATIGKILRDQFLPENRFARIEYLFMSVRLKLKQLESDIGNKGYASQKELQEIRTKLESPEFEQAVAIAAEEATRASDQKVVARFGSILVGSLTPAPWYGPPEDVAAMIRAIAQLGDIDILVLRELETAFRGVRGPNFNLPNVYTGNMAQLREAIRRSGLHEDDFHAVCSRLVGFGLALEEDRNVSRMELHERCFRPTHRGETLLVLIGEQKTKNSDATQ